MEISRVAVEKTLATRDISIPVDLQAAIIKPSLPTPWLFGAFWSTFERTHRSFVSFTAAAVAATQQPDAAVA